MKQHRYRITVEHLALPDGTLLGMDRSFSFETGNHDDISAIVARMNQRGDLPQADSTALAVGLKLFSEVILQHRGHPLFADFMPHFKTFMQRIKQGPSTLEQAH